MRSLQRQRVPKVWIACCRDFGPCSVFVPYSTLVTPAQKQPSLCGHGNLLLRIILSSCHMLMLMSCHLAGPNDKEEHKIFDEVVVTVR